MSTDTMQRMSDLEVENEQLNVKVTALETENRALKSATPNPQELATAISVVLDRNTQNLIEGFGGRFANNVLPSIEMFKNKMEKLEQRLSVAEEREQSLGDKFNTYKAHIDAKLDETVKKQHTMLVSFNNALKKHYTRHDEIIIAMQAIAEGCNNAAHATMNSAALCTGFEKDYQSVASRAGQALTTTSEQTRVTLSGFVSNVVDDIKKAVYPVIEEVDDLSHKKWQRRLIWSVIGIYIVLFFSFVQTYYMQPTPWQLRDAAKWRSFTQDLSQEEYNKVITLLDEIEKAQKARDGKPQ